MDSRLALARGERGALMQQLRADTALLAGMHVMDYSLLLGVHYPRWGEDGWRPPRPRAGQARRCLALFRSLLRLSFWA
jgi:hypothetical protein